MTKKIYHRISNAYDAWWFAYYHPKLNCRERTEVTPEEADKMEAGGFIITRDKGGKCYREWRHLYRHATEENLSIHYSKVDKRRRVNDDATKNANVECWLEFGPLEYGYMAGGQYDWDTETGLLHYHDTDLDCGAKTFDEALVILAKLIRKKYGDWKEMDYKTGRSKECGKVVPCADCQELKQTIQKMGLKPKK